MTSFFRNSLSALLIAMLLVSTIAAATEDLGNGFLDHGIATPISNHRGTVATVDGDGKPVVLSWIMDHRGGYALLMVDAATGKSEQFPTPWTGDSPFASILSSRNRFYTHCGGWFVEFDPVKRDFTFQHETFPRMAMSMTEDDQGVIWSASYPQSGVVSYDPAAGRFRDYGHVYKQNWRQYPRNVVADDQGWIYLGIGNTKCQIVILNRESGEAVPVVPEAERVHGRAVLMRDVNGKVYGRAGKQWYELYGGKATRIEKPEKIRAKRTIASSQKLFHRAFPTGDKLLKLDLVERRLEIEAKDGEKRTIAFDYTSDGAHLMGLAAAPGGTIAGGTAFPMRFFSYDPAKDAWTNRAAFGQWNTVAPTADRFFVGAYTGGYLMEWDPAREWVATKKDDAASNPRILAHAKPDINRPHDLLAHPDGRHVILAGTPGYGLTGGGLLFWDRQDEKATIVKHDAIIPWHSTMSLVALPGGKLLGGTTVNAGTGGESKAQLAELYIMDMATKRVEWHGAPLKDVATYVDMIMGPKGLVFGFAGRERFFVFDPARRAIVKEMDTEAQFGPTTYHQGPRVFVPSPDGRIFVLFSKGIAELDPETTEITMLAESPVAINAGGAWLDGRVYFAHASHLYSWPVPAKP